MVIMVIFHSFLLTFTRPGKPVVIPSAVAALALSSSLAPYGFNRKMAALGGWKGFPTSDPRGKIFRQTWLLTEKGDE